MTDHRVPDYPADDLLVLEEVGQFRALFDDTRMEIIALLSERAATTSQIADVLERPKGTIGHHMGVLEEAGLIRVVRTEKVRAIEAKYYGRTALTFELSRMHEAGLAPNRLLAEAADEVAAGRDEFADDEVSGFLSVRYARIPPERAEEWENRLNTLMQEFIDEPRSGPIVYGLALALYPTRRRYLPDRP